MAALGYPVTTFRRLCWPAQGSDVDRPQDHGLRPDPFEVLADDGLALRGWSFVPDQPWGTVMVCHSRGTGKSRTLRQARMLYDRGLAVVTFDFRGCGESDRPARQARSSLWGPLRDMAAITGYIDGRIAAGQLPAGRVALLGCSFGGNMALAHAGTAQGRYPAMILDSTPLVRWQTMLRAQLERERRAARYRRARAAADGLIVRGAVAWTRAESLYRHATASAHRLRETAVLLIVGERDSFYDIEESQRFLREHYAGKQHIWRVPRGRHLTNHLVEPETYATRIVGLLRTAFGTGSGS